MKESKPNVKHADRKFIKALLNDTAFSVTNTHTHERTHTHTHTHTHTYTHKHTHKVVPGDKET